MTTGLLDPLDSSQWDKNKARHLLSRAGFGVPLAAVDDLAKLDPVGAVASLLDYEKNSEPNHEPDWLEPPTAGRDLRRQVTAMEALNSKGHELTDEEKKQREEETKKLFNALQQEERQDIEKLKAWWLKRILITQRPLQEKMTLFWHGHFAVSAEKVKSGYHNYMLNKLFRDKATGNFKMLAYEVGISPAMLRYLDNDQNNKNHPNENWARELMELFTLGVGNYTEDDIKNSARAFTGWTSNGEEFVYNPQAHDDGDKTFMGKKGKFNGNDIVDIIFEQKAAARFLPQKLWKFFAYEDPEPEIVDGLAKTFRENGYELKPLLKQIFLSKAFYSEKAVQTQIKSPVQLAVSMLSYLDVNPPADSITERYVVLSLRMMGQDLFYPPNVKGWDGGKAWINTNTLMVRYNLANFLVQGVATNVGPGMNIQQMLQRSKRKIASPTNAKQSKLERAKEAMMKGDAMDQEMEMGMGMEGDMGMSGRMDMKDVGVVGDSTGPKGMKLPFAPFDAMKFFGKGSNLTVAQVADYLSDYFYGRPMGQTQQGEVLEAMTGGSSPAEKLNVQAWDVGRLRGAVRLMLSATEFQVC